ncbi:MAG TPA: DUF4176 domain-containing protein [Pseudogracilibacillus sp.]|nr:DUF4176 domain-containing protein [Pseudogracilibacillus sp.]
MIISRVPLYEQNGVIGYFDYSGCIYPTGSIEEGAYFFNHENIEEIYFGGYKNVQEEQFLEKHEKKLENISYLKFTTEE